MSDVLIRLAGADEYDAIGELRDVAAQPAAAASGGCWSRARPVRC
jgi:hypothetical protein